MEGRRKEVGRKGSEKEGEQKRKGRKEEGRGEGLCVSASVSLCICAHMCIHVHICTYAYAYAYACVCACMPVSSPPPASDCPYVEADSLDSSLPFGSWGGVPWPSRAVGVDVIYIDNTSLWTGMAERTPGLGIRTDARRHVSTGQRGTPRGREEPGQERSLQERRAGWAGPTGQTSSAPGLVVSPTPTLISRGDRWQEGPGHFPTIAYRNPAATHSHTWPNC